MTMYAILAATILFGPYQADLVEVKDGDTILLDVHVWPGHTQSISVREWGIDTPEKRTRNLCEKELGIKATSFTADFIQNKTITVTNISLGKYAGRVLGNIYADGDSLSEALLDIGLAIPYYGGSRDHDWCE